MRYPRNVRVFRGQWDALPFLSVFFLLVLFLALESRMAFVPGVAIDLPEGKGTPVHSGVSLMVAVDHMGQVYYENQAVSASELAKRLGSDVNHLKVPVTLIVQADKAVTNEKLIELAGLAKGVGVRDVLLATRQPGIPPAAKARP